MKDQELERNDDEQLRIVTQQRRIRRAQERAKRYLKLDASLVDELLAARRDAASHE